MDKAVDKTVAFKMAYLLGVEETVLQRDYEIPYAASGNLKLFANYEDAIKLRNLSRMRQSVLRYNHLYKNTSSVAVATKNYLLPELNQLLADGIDIESIYKEKDLITYLNILTEMIEVIVFKVLVDLDVPRPEVMQDYFKFPAFDKRNLDRFLTVYKTWNCPHGIILYKGANIKTSLSFSLTNDKNIFYSIYSMRGERYDSGVEDTDSYVWRTEKGVSLDEQAVINVADVVNKVKSTKEVMIHNQEIAAVEEPAIVTNIHITEHKVPEVMHNTTVMNVGGSIESFLKQGDLEVFVDCDNTHFFKFLNFIRSVESHKTIKAVNLIADLKSSFLWRMFTELYKGKLNIEVVTVKRLKEQKSVADIVLTSKLCEKVYKNKVNRVMLMSSDSDFYGLIHTVKKDVAFCVCYTDVCTNDEYLKYLTSEGVVTYDLTGMDTIEIVNAYKNICIEYLLAYTLSLTPIYKWDLSNIISIVSFNFNKETALEIESDYIAKRVEDLMQGVCLKVDAKSTYIKVNSVEIDASLL